MKTIRIAHLYPDRMSIYGDYGNIITLVKRMAWRGIKSEVHSINEHQKLPGDIDLIFMGGGQDKGQVIVAKDLKEKSARIKDLVENGCPLLAVCGGYQLLGEYFISSEYGELEGIGLFNVITRGTRTRMIGNIVVQSELFGELVGFENHSGATEFVGRAHPLGRVKKGYGNNPTEKHEGALYKNAIGTYMHGSFLPKNPLVADWLIQRALSKDGEVVGLKDLDDTIELMARKSSISRPQ